MASGRHGGYRRNEFRDRESDFVSRKEIGYSRGEFDRIKRRGKEYERVPAWVRDSLEYNNGRVRESDVGYRSTSSRSDSDSSGSVPKRGSTLVVRPVDREPGELSSDGSDGSVDMENGVQLSPVQNKKRKYSPIIWDKYVERTVNSSSNNLTPQPSSVEVFQESHNSVSNTQTNVTPSVVGDIGGRIDYPVLREEEPMVSGLATEVIEDEDCVPARTIISSRWANDADSPADEGEISDYEDKQKSTRKSASGSTDVREYRKSVTPEFGEMKTDGSEGRIRSSSRESFHDNDDNSDHMEIDDDDDRNGKSSHYDTESEDDLRSNGTPGPLQTPQRSFNMLQGCRSVDEFERLNKIDEGTYGVVYRARDKKTGEIVALKKVKMEREREGFPLTALREINILLSLHHPSIVDVKEVVVGSNLDSIFMVMEYMEHDLKALMETMKQPYSQSEVKCLMIQLLTGIKYLHDNWVLHRDLKTSNLLLNNQGELKLCDFGLARQYGSPLKPYTQLVVTLWYRAPELLLGAKQYSTAIDMWSLGCIMAELLSKEPLFNGKTEVEQLDKIFKILGTPNETIWPGLSKLPGTKVNFIKHKYNLLRRKFPATSFTGSPVLSDAGFDLLNKMLTYDPDKRITAEAALNHEWFREVPLPKSKEFMPTFPARHAQDRRTRRMMKSPDPLEEQRRKELQGELGGGGLFGQ